MGRSRSRSPRYRGDCNKSVVWFDWILLLEWDLSAINNNSAPDTLFAQLRIPHKHWLNTFVAAEKSGCVKLLLWVSGSQTFSDLVPSVSPVFSPHTTLKTLCSRKTQSTQNHSIKSLANQTWRKYGINNMAVRNYNGRFSKLIRRHSMLNWTEKLKMFTHPLRFWWKWAHLKELQK